MRTVRVCISHEDSPFLRILERNDAVSRASDGGFARVVPRSGEMVAYATASNDGYAGISSVSGIIGAARSSRDYRFAAAICNGLFIAMRRDKANGRRPVIVPQLLSYLIATASYE